MHGLQRQALADLPDCQHLHMSTTSDRGRSTHFVVLEQHGFQKHLTLRRQDTWSDLQLVLVVNLTVIALFGWIKSSVVDALDTTLAHAGPKPFWLSIYEARWHSRRRLSQQHCNVSDKASQSAATECRPERSACKHLCMRPRSESLQTRWVNSMAELRVHACALRLPCVTLTEHACSASLRPARFSAHIWGICRFT